MKCQNCGTEIQEQAKFCPKCGSKVEQPPVVKAPVTGNAPHDISNIWPEWQIEKQLGRGSYGVVYQAIRRDNNVESHAAIKIISIPSDYSEVDSLRSEGLDMDGTRTYFKGIVDDFVSEIQLMESLKGIQNIVSVEDYKVVEKTDTIGWDIYIRMELLAPFNTYICDKTLTEEEIIKLGADICTALEICGQRNIIHRDIKPENIFVNDFGYFKLGDFGIARKLKNMTGGLSQKGTFNYMAPEVANSNEYDARVDTYSLGIVLYRLLNNNKLPFLDTDKQLLNPNERKLAVERRIRGEELPAPCNASPSMANLILRACAHNPNARFASATEMKQALMSVANGTYTIVDTGLDRTTSVRSAGVNYDVTTAVRRATGTVEQNEQPVVNTFGDVPKKKKGKKAKAIVISVLSIVLVIAIAMFASYIYDDYKDSSETNSVLEQADEYYENGDYEKAISEYSKVPKSSKNYDEAQEKLNQVYADYISSTVATAKKLNSTKNYKQAIQTVNTAYDILPDTVDTAELDTVKEESLTSYKTEVANEVTELTEDEKWSEAFELIDEAIPFDDNEYFHNLKASTEDDYVKSVNTTVQQYLKSKDYTGALRTVESALTVLPNNSDLAVLKKTVNDETPTYLFDTEPFMVENARVYMRNNDTSTITSTGSWYYPTGYTMHSAGEFYSKGMSITPNSGKQTKIHYNLGGKYSTLSGMIAFEDLYSDRVDKEYAINFYADGTLVGSYTIQKSDLPQSITVDLRKCNKLTIELVRPLGDGSDNPNINLIEFGMK